MPERWYVAHYAPCHGDVQHSRPDSLCHADCRAPPPITTTMCNTGAGEKLKSDADVALQAQLQREQQLAASIAEAASRTEECVRLQATCGINDCKQGAAETCLLQFRVELMTHLCRLISSNYSSHLRSGSVWLCCSCGEAGGKPAEVARSSADQPADS